MRLCRQKSVKIVSPPAPPAFVGLRWQKIRYNRLSAGAAGFCGAPPAKKLLKQVVRQLRWRLRGSGDKKSVRGCRGSFQLSWFHPASSFASRLPPPSDILFNDFVRIRIVQLKLSCEAKLCSFFFSSQMHSLKTRIGEDFEALLKQVWFQKSLCLETARGSAL